MIDDVVDAAAVSDGDVQFSIACLGIGVARLYSHGHSPASTNG